MVAKGYFNRFLEWQNYAHYLLNGFFLFIEFLLFSSFFARPVELLIYSSMFIFINDSIIHAIFWYAPKPIRWRD